MATTNTGNENVLVIKIENNEVESVSHESRSVYENTKGRFIKTVNDGQIFLSEENHAVIAYRREQIPGRRWYRRIKYQPSKQEVESLLHTMFLNYRLDGFIK